MFDSKPPPPHRINRMLGRSTVSEAVPGSQPAVLACYFFIRSLKKQPCCAPNHTTRLSDKKNTEPNNVRRVMKTGPRVHTGHWRYRNKGLFWTPGPLLQLLYNSWIETLKDGCQSNLMDRGLTGTKGINDRTGVQRAGPTESEQVMGRRSVALARPEKTLANIRPSKTAREHPVERNSMLFLWGMSK